LGGWSRDYPSANAIREPLFASYSVGSYNFCRHANPVVDRMIARFGEYPDYLKVGVIR